ncbi:MAG TPA: penicillin-binding protein 2, partial [Nitratifractor sp.]|nr:penicillin-binding protein 2 [Nitratifractor sp.]
MSQDKTKIIMKRRIKYIIITMVLLCILLLLRLATLAAKDNSEIKTIALKERALRGDIISREGYTISRSIKNYTVSIHTKYLDPNRKEFFLKLFSIYSNI